MTLIILVAVCMFVCNNYWLLRKEESTTRGDAFFPVANCCVKEPSVSLTMEELMETNGEEWLNYYRNHTSQLSLMTLQQKMCAYRCWSQQKCLAFIYEEALMRACGLIFSPSDSHFRQSDCTYYKVSMGVLTMTTTTTMMMIIIIIS